MQTTARRYTTPATPPPLVSTPVGPMRAAAAAPLLCIRCGAGSSRARGALVSFGWGRVVEPTTRG
jgi:hypothetical protein